MQEKMDQYADLNVEMVLLSEKMTALKEEIAIEMTDGGLDKLETPKGSFYFMNRKTWTYPELVNNAIDGVKKLKKDAEASGEATFVSSQSFAFKAKVEGAEESADASVM